MDTCRCLSLDDAQMQSLRSIATHRSATMDLTEFRPSPCAEDQRVHPSTTTLTLRDSTETAQSSCCDRFSIAFEHLKSSYLRLSDWNEGLSEDMDHLRHENSSLSQQLVALQKHIEELRGSHTDLLSKMTSLSCSVQLHSEMAASRTHRNRFSTILADNVLTDVSLSFVEMISTHSPALTRRITNPTELTTVCMERALSEPSNCTLLEMQAVLDALRSKGALFSRCLPSAYHFDFADTSKVERLAILFPDYCSMCEALAVPVSIRAKGLYREQRRRDQSVRAVQIAGSALFAPPATSSSVLLGRADLNHDIQATILRHDRPVWHNIDWDRGFDLNTFPTNSDGFRQLREQILPSIAASRAFQLVWERKKAQSTIGLSRPTADSVRGRLRALIPLVIIRGKKLISTTHHFLGTPRSPSSVITDLCSPIQSDF